jgi:hypothetical protein
MAQRIRGRLRPWLGALLVFGGLTCTDSTGVRPGQAVVGFAPVFGPTAAAIYSNLVDGGLAIDNIRIQLRRSNGAAARDTVVVFAGQDSLVIELVVDIEGSAETLNALIDMRDGNTVLFSGSQSLVAVAGTTPSSTPQIPMKYEGPGATVVALDLQPADSAITAGDSIVYRPIAKNKDSATVADFALLWSVKDAARGTISESGVFKPSAGRGSTWVIAKTFTDLKDSARVSITPPATKLVVIAGDAQTGTVNGQLPQLLVVESQAADNLPVPGVTATLFGPPGTVVIQMADKTDQNGRISFSVPVGTIAGPIAFSVTSPGLPTLALTGTAVAAAPTKLALSQQPSPTASSGAALATQPRVQLQDQFGNAAAVAGKPVVATLTTPTGRTLGGTTTVNTDANGVATFTDISVSGVTGSLTLTFTQDALTAATSNAITLGAGSAAKVVLTTRPSASVVSGAAFATQPVAQITDASGNPVTTSTAVVTASAGAGYTMVGSASVTAGAGVATFVGLGVSGAAASTQMTFAATSLVSDTATVSVLPAIGPPATITAATPVAFTDSIQAHVATANLATVVVKDAQNVVVPGVAVTFRLFGGPGALINGSADSLVETTDANGVAKLMSQRLRDLVGADSIFARIATLTDTIKFVATVTNGAPHQLAVSTQPGNTNAGQAFTTVVAVRDRLNNPATTIPGSPPNVTLAISTGTGASGAVLSPSPVALTQPAVSGIASFSAAIDLTGTGYKLTATAPGLIPVETGAFDITEAAGPAAALFAASPVAFLDTIGGAVASSNLVAVVVTDASEIPVPGVEVTFVLRGGLGARMNGSTDTVVTVMSDANGIATLTSMHVRDSIGVDTVLVTAAVISDTLEFLAGVLNGAPHHLAVLAHPNSTEAGDIITSVVVTQDRHDNITTFLSGTPPDVTIAIKSGTGTTGAVLSPNPSALTQSAVGGIASFSASIDLVGTGYALAISSPGLATIETNAFDLTTPLPTVSWIAASDGNWSDGTKWSGGSPPTSVDHAVIDLSGTYTVTADVNVTVAKLTLGGSSGVQTLTASSKTVNLSGPSTIGLNGAMVLTGGGVAGSGVLENNGLLQIQGGVSFTGTFSNEPGGTLRLMGSSSTSTATLTTTNGFVNAGTLELTSSSGHAAALSVATGTLVNEGVIRSLTSGTRTLTAQLENNGTLEVDALLTMDKADADHVNNGTIDLTTQNLSISQTGTSPTFTNSPGATVTLGASRTFTVSGGSVDLSTGSVNGTSTSTLSVSSATLAFLPQTVGVRMTLTSTSIVGESVTIGSGKQVTLFGGTLNVPVTVLNGGYLVINGSVSLTDATPLILPTGSTLRIEGTSNTSSGALTTSNGFTNDGTIELTSSGGHAASLTVSSGTLTNTGLIQTLGSGTRTLTAQLDNQGELELFVALVMNASNAAHVNSGVIDLTTTNLSLFMSGSPASFTNTATGSITLGASRIWSVDGGLLDIDEGTVSGPTTSRINVSNASIAFTTANVTVPLQFTGTSIVGGGITIPNGETLTLRGGTVSDPLSVASGGTLLIWGFAALSHATPLNLPSGSTLRIEGSPTTSSGFLTVANAFTNGGTIELTSTSGHSSGLLVSSGTLTNTGTIRSLTTGSRTLTAPLDNQGTLEVDAALTIDRSDAVHVNSGLIDLTTADLTVNQTGTTPSFTNTSTGSVTLGASRNWAVNGGLLDIDQGVVTGPSTARLITTGVTLEFTPVNVAIPLTLGTTTIVGGAVSIPTGDTLTLRGGSLSDPVTVQAGGVLLINGSVSLTHATPLTLPTGSKVLVNGSPTTSTGELTTTNGFTNSGTIELTSTSGHAATLGVTTGTLTNIGLLRSVTTGTRTLAARLSNQGTLEVDAALTIDKADAHHYNYNAIDLTEANLTVTQTGTAPSFGNGIAGVITLGANRQLIINGGTANFTGGSVVQGPTTSTLVMSGGTLNFTAATVAVPLNLSTTSLSGGALTIGSTETVKLFGGTVADPITVQSGGTLWIQSSVSLTHATPLDLQSGSNLTITGSTATSTGVLTALNGFTNNGTIDLKGDGGLGATLAVTTGTLTNGAAGTINATNAGAKTLAAQLDNQGMIAGNVPLTLDKASAQHLNSGVINLTVGTMTVTQSGTTPTFTNSGTIQLATGKTFTVSGGEFTNAGGGPTGTIQGPGTVNVSTAAFTNDGIMAPVGVLAVTGPYVQNATNGAVNVTISSSTTYGQLNVSGTATLAGALNVVLNAFDPPATTTFTVMTYGSMTGALAPSLPTLTGGKTWQVTQGATSIVLTVLAP